MSSANLQLICVCAGWDIIPSHCPESPWRCAALRRRTGPVALEGLNAGQVQVSKKIWHLVKVYKKALLIIKGSCYTFDQLHSLCHWASSWWLKLTNWWINLVFVVLFVSIPWRQQNKKWICIYHCNSYRLMTWEPLWSNCLISLPYMFPFILEMEICQNHLKFSWTDVDWVKGLAQGHLASGNEGGARAFHRLILSVQRI